MKYVQDRISLLGKEMTGPTIQAAMLRRGMMIEERARQLAPEASGKLRKSFFSKMSATEKNIYVKVGNDAPYAAYVEEGTRPHMPPVAAIAGWVRIKNLVGSNPRKIIQRRGLRLERTDEEMVLAWAIAKKIAKAGTKAQHFFKRAIRDVDEKGKENVYRAVEHTIRQIWGR